MANEKRLIDADEALRMMRNSKQDNPYTDRKLGGIWDIAHDCAISCVEAESCTVDAVEVVHGEWAIFEDGWNSEVIYECSVCKEAFVTLDGEPMEKLWNYCPNCGAKMDGDGNA